MRKKSRMSTRMTAGALAVTMALTSYPAASSDWIGDFYRSAGAAVNVTQPSAIATQSALGFSGGGVVWRVPNKTLHPFRITPPSLKTGCGGIDMYLGSYSFPNKEEFVQALRNFGQAALGYFFQLALRTMAPEIATTLDYINEIANKMNQFSMNACSSAKQFVDTFAAPIMQSATRDGSGFKRAIGDAVDEIDGWFGLAGNTEKIREANHEQTYGKKESNVTKEDVQEKNMLDGNILRYALDASDTTNAMDESEKDLIMSMIGPTLIIRPKNENYETDGPTATFGFKELVGNDTASDGNQRLTVLTCSGSDAKCMNPTANITYVKPFRTRVLEAVKKIRQNVSSRSVASSLSGDELIVLKLASVPIYRAAAMAESSGVAAGVANNLMGDLSEYVALEAGIHFVNHYMTAAERALVAAMPKVKQIYHASLRTMIDRIPLIKQDMYNEVAQYYKLKKDPFAMIDQLDKVERAMYANLNVALAANAHFSE